MPDILLAISKGLAGVPGLAPVFNPLISLREEEKAEAANVVLLDRLSEGNTVSREALDEILVEILGVRQNSQLLREQMVAGFYAVLKLMHDRKALHLGVEQELLLPEGIDLEGHVSELLHDNQDVLVEEGLVTREVLRDELVHHFSDVRTLLAIAQPAGFPKGWVPTTVAPILAYYDFLENCDGLEEQKVARIARAISRKKPGSTILRRWAEMYAAYAAM